MSKPLKLEYVRDRIPVCYRHNPVLRWFMIAISFAIMVYSIYFMMRYVSNTSPIFFKILPIAIAFVGLDSVLKKITSLNSVTFEQDRLRLGFIAKRALEIPYENIRKLELYRKITFYFGISYIDLNGKEKKYTAQASFPHTLEIILNIADMAPKAAIPDQMQSIVDYLKSSVQDGIQQDN